MFRLIGFAIFLQLVPMCAQSQSGLVITEFMANNDAYYRDPDNNQFVDWIELHNSDTQTVHLGGCFLTDDLAIPAKYRIPEGTFIPPLGYALFWADGAGTLGLGVHLSFKLDKDKEQIGLFSNDTTLIDSVSYLTQKKDVSYGLDLESGLWLYYADPTPGAANNGVGSAQPTRCMAPALSQFSGFYEDAVLLGMTTLEPGSEIRYTTDGSIPNSRSTLYVAPLDILASSVVRARTFGGDKLPSTVVSASYLIREMTTLPVVSIICDPEFLWDSVIGIYQDYEVQKRKEWERPAFVQYFSSDRQLRFGEDADLRLYGATAIELPQKSLSVLLKDPVQYKLYPDKNIDKIKSFILRSSSDDWAMTLFRDGMLQTLVAGYFKMDHQSYQPATVLINGQYFGIHNIREKLNEDFLEENKGVHPDSIDLLQLNYWDYTYEVKNGSGDKFDEMTTFIRNADLTDSVNYKQVRTFMNVDNYIDYIIFQVFIGNLSWRHNIKVWRPHTAGGVWEWLPYDLDRGYFDADRRSLAYLFDYDQHFSRLLNNTDFFNEFMQRFTAHMNISFNTSRVLAAIEQAKARIAYDMPWHIERWKGRGGIQSLAGWEWYMDINRSFAQSREAEMYAQLDSAFGLSETVDLVLVIDSLHRGDVRIMDVPLPYSDSTLRCFKDIPLRLTATPRPGYVFDGWNGVVMDEEIEVMMTDDTTIVARFKSVCEFDDVIEGEFAFLRECSPYYINRDLLVDSLATLTVEAGVEIILGQDVSVVVKGSLLVEGTDSLYVNVHAADGARWSRIMSYGGTIVLKHTEIRDASQVVYAVRGSLTISGCRIYESDVNVNDVIVAEICTVNIKDSYLYGNPTNSKKDGIDCAWLNSCNITGNTFVDITDDAIDMGPECSNVTIEGNRISHCGSMGISIGERSTADVIRNMIHDCEAGLQVHTGSVVHARNNTLYGNHVGIRAYHYNTEPASGGIAIVLNTIISQSLVANFDQVDNSEVTFSYCLSDTDTLPGDYNLLDLPGFMDIEAGDFSLTEQSPCIDAGDPSSPKDPDSSTSDIGAFFFDHTQDRTPAIQDALIWLYPNPAEEALYIKFKSGSDLRSIRLLDMTGKLIQEYTDVTARHARLELDGLTTGLYVLRVEISGVGVITEKVVVR